MVMRINYILFFLLLFWSCNDNNTSSIPIIDFTKFNSHSDGLEASSIFSEINYIQLETTKDCLLGPGQIVYVDNSQIVIRSESELFRFSDTGLFLNKIGAKGNAPGEYLYPGNIYFDNTLPVFKVVDLQRKKTLMFEPNGKYVGEEKNVTSKECMEYWYLDNQSVIASFRKESKDKVRDELYILNTDGDTLYSYFDAFMDGAQKISFFYYPSIQQTSANTIIKLPFNDTIFSAHVKNGFTPIAVQHFGNEKITRQIAEDFNLNKKFRNDYINEVFSLVSDRYIFLSYNKKNAKYCVVFDRVKNKVTGMDKLLYEDYVSRQAQLGIIVTTEKSGFKFFPKYVSGNTAYDLIYYPIDGKSAEDNPIILEGFMR